MDIYGQGWLIAIEVDHNWKKNTLPNKNKGKKYIFDLRNQSLSEEAASSYSSKSDSRKGRSKKVEGHMALNIEGILDLQPCFEDETRSFNGLFHWRMKDYKVF